MTAVALQSTEAAPGRGLAGLLVLVSIVAIAQSSDHLDLSVTLDDLQKEAIYASADDEWRNPEVEAEQEEWRQPEKKAEAAPKSRITFGYESFYDDPAMRRDQTTTVHDLEIEKYRPSSAFQIKF